MTKTTSRVRCLFGTDGVRDVANRGSMTPEMALCLSRAFVFFLVERGISTPRIAIGRDTRRSGTMLEAAMVAGMTSAGAQVTQLGVFTTPGVSFITSGPNFDAGAVISASHNPAEYNGIKFLNANGEKLSDEDELAIEDYIGDNLLDEWRPTGASVGQAHRDNTAWLKYANWLMAACKSIFPLPYPLVVDGANGAASSLVKELLGKYPGISFCGVSPDGLNINEGAGVMHMDNLKSVVIENKAKLGIALDGDADRVLMCDSQGRIIDGDLMLWIMAIWLHKKGQLGTGLVATVMSNMVLEEKMAEHAIPMFRCNVGDRYVVEMMKKKGSLLGGEQSGHIIASDYVATGDGLSSALLFLRACQELDEDIDTLNDRFLRCPQLLKNVTIKKEDNILEAPEFQQILKEVETRLSGIGRVLVRPSGTEPILRVMVEARDPQLMDSTSLQIIDVINRIRSAGGESHSH